MIRRGLAAVIENLADLGYRVIPARDAAEALELLQSEDRIDIMFSDVVMPGGMNGVQLAVEARRLRPGLRVLLTSGYTNDAWGGDHRVPADVPILTKPYRREQLAQHLQLCTAARKKVCVGADHSLAGARPLVPAKRATRSYGSNPHRCGGWCPTCRQRAR